jgi:RNA polymerase sigma-70 factor (ECF subfamily)
MRPGWLEAAKSFSLVKQSFTMLPAGRAAGFGKAMRAIMREEPRFWPMDEQNDDQLMRLSGAGDKTAFSRLVARHANRAGRLAHRVAGNRADAEEIVQEAFVRAWIKAPSWADRDGGGTASFATWLHRVIVNLCVDRKRRPASAPIDAAGEIADHGPDGFALAARRETGARVAAAVAALPDRQRAALVMCHYEGMSNIEASAVLEISVGALESLLVRARRTLREALSDMALEAREVGR